MRRSSAGGVKLSISLGSVLSVDAPLQPAELREQPATFFEVFERQVQLHVVYDGPATRRYKGGAVDERPRTRAGGNALQLLAY